MPPLKGNHPASGALLTIAIPTRNRALKVVRLLELLERQLVQSGMRERVEIFVSDNASSAANSEVIAFKGASQRFRYVRQRTNLGFDGNLQFLYDQTTTPYIWFMGDDDYPLPGAVAKMVESIESCWPDLVLSSFVQPPGSQVRQFEYEEPLHICSVPSIIIEHLVRYPKLSIFAMKRIDFDVAQRDELRLHIGLGHFFISLAFAVLESSVCPRLAIVSEALATCDDDWMVVRFSPEVFRSMHKIANHPFATLHAPELRQRLLEEGYFTTIEFAFSAKTGALVPDSMRDYDRSINNLEWRPIALVRRPRFLVKFIFLKLRLAPLWARTRQKTKLLCRR